MQLIYVAMCCATLAVTVSSFASPDPVYQSPSQYPHASDSDITGATSAFPDLLRRTANHPHCKRLATEDTRWSNVESKTTARTSRSTNSKPPTTTKSNPPTTTKVYTTTTEKVTTSKWTSKITSGTTDIETSKTTKITTTGSPLTTGTTTPVTTSLSMSTTPSTTRSNNPSTTPSTTPSVIPSTTPSTTPSIRPSTTPTTTTSSSGPSCGTNKPNPVLKDCQPGTCPRRELSCSIVSSQNQCEAKCNEPTSGCIAYNYNANNGYCVTYGDCDCPTTCGADRPSPVLKDCQPGTCPRRELSCSLVSSQNQCEAKCNEPTSGCIAYNYNANNGYCVTYGDCDCPTTCGADRPSPVLKDCQPGTCPRRELSCSLVSTRQACEAKCNEPTSGCIAYNYNANNGYCVTYGDCDCPTTCGADRPSPVLKDCQPGSCPRRELSCSLVSTRQACEAKCNEPTSGCIAYNYNANNGYCVTYGDCDCPSSCGSDRPSPPQRDCQPGSCPRPETSCSLVNSEAECQDKCNDPSLFCYSYIYNSNNDYCTTYGNCQCPA